MSGQNTSDDDFLDDEFVVEGLADQSPRDDLGLLFTAADAPKPAEPPPVSGSAPAPDAEDDLFTDHTSNLTPTEQFHGREQFDEQAASTWSGENLELDSDAVAAVPQPAATEVAGGAEDAWRPADADAFVDEPEGVVGPVEIVGQQAAPPTPPAGESPVAVTGLGGEELPVLDPVMAGEELPWLAPVTEIGARAASANDEDAAYAEGEEFAADEQPAEGAAYAEGEEFAADEQPAEGAAYAEGEEFAADEIGRAHV